MNPSTFPHPAPGKFAGWACPACQQPLATGSSIIECAECGAPHHTACWVLSDACRSYECSSASGKASASAQAAADDLAGGSVPGGASGTLPSFSAVPPEGPPTGGPARDAIVIRPGDVKSVEIEEVAVRSGGAVQPVKIARFVERRTSRLAVAALILGIAGLFLFGVPGVFAAVTGAIALGGILNDRRLKGSAWAALGIGLGVISVTGWLAAAILYFWSPENTRGAPPVQFTSGVSTPRLDDAPPEIQNLLKANVHITGSSRSGLVGRQEWLGSGVVYRSGGNEVVLLTNRHVVDPDFAAGQGGGRVSEAELQITFYNGETVKGTVDWIAPSGVDIALVRCPPPVGGVTLVPYDPVRSVRISDMVFAIGNPEGLGWSYTQGPVSGFRSYPSEGEDVVVLQTQTPLNPGNSGGGLYDREGFLVGINTWTQDKRVAEGLNFAISMVTVDRLLLAAGKARK